MADAFSDSHGENTEFAPAGDDNSNLEKSAIRDLKSRIRNHAGDKDPKPLFLEMNYGECQQNENYRKYVKQAVDEEIEKHFEHEYRAANKDVESSGVGDASVLDNAMSFVKHAISRIEKESEKSKYSNDTSRYQEQRYIEATDYPVVYLVYGNEETGAYKVKLTYASTRDKSGSPIWFGESEQRDAVLQYINSIEMKPEASLEANGGDGVSAAEDTQSSRTDDSGSFPQGVNPDRYKWNRGFTVYVGETNEIARRVSEHLKVDPNNRGDWETVAEHVEKDPGSYKQILISDQYFTKSMTEDIEDRLINYMMGVPDVKHLMNRRGNPQSNYHESGKTDQIFNQIWRGLSDFWKENHPNSPVLFPNEQIIFDSALFKASPFHRLTEEQSEAVERITDIVREKLNAFSKAKKTGKEPTRALILVAGAAGTGKTVLLSHLFYHLNDELTHMKGRSGNTDIELIVNHDQQLTVYRNLCAKLGIAHDKDSKGSSKRSVNTAHVDKAATFINGKTELIAGEVPNKDDKSKMKKINLHNYDEPTGTADVTLVDEAHLLFTKDSQAYQGGNQLYDVILRSKVTVAVFDPGQILQERCDWSPELISVLFTEGRYGLSDSEFANDGPSRTSNKQQDRASRVVDLPIIQMKTPDLNYWENEYLGIVKKPEIERINRRQLTVDVTNVLLTKQMRVSADDATIDWIDNLVSEKNDDEMATEYGIIKPIPVDCGEMCELKEDNYRNFDGSFSMPDSGKIEWSREPYEIKVFDSPVELFQNIYKKAVPNDMHRHEGGLSRVIATYDWAYTAGKVNAEDPCGFWNVEMTRDAGGNWNIGLSDEDENSIDSDIAASEGHEGSVFAETFGEKAKDVEEPDQSIVDSMPTDRFCMPWNMELTKYASPSKAAKEAIEKQASGALVSDLKKTSKRFAPKQRQVQEDLSWAEQEHTIFEVGSTYTIQGFDLNVAGVIIGPSVKYRNGKIQYDPEASCDQYATVKQGVSEEDRKRNIRNQFNVLVKRGVHGLYLFAADKALRDKLRDEYAKYEEEKKRVDAQNKEDWHKRVEEFKRHLEAKQKQEKREDEDEEASVR